MKPTVSRRFQGRTQQRGAVLYVALMLLILLSLIGVVGMQVASMQERMSSNYRAANVAFQASERAVRDAERSIE
ncbi:pilus assembly PilX family protein, partial [Enterobacter hormaechei]|uniref:pilus assembly PilX family protein n=2 Tax=Gammaproteobacteria TaxID=1236 RepID=UPI00203EE093